MSRKNKDKETPEKEKMESSFSKNFNIFSVVIIALSVLAVYSNSFNNSFHYDDIHHIFQSKHNKSFDSFKDLSFWFHFIQRAPAQFTFAINYYFGEYSLFGYHAVNVIIHFISSILVFILTGAILNSAAIKQQIILSNKKIISLFTALIFAVHPIQTESVTYIVQRMESLSFLFYTAALIMYFLFRYEQGTLQKIIKFVVFAISGILAVMTKQTAYTLPLTILLLELYFIRDQKGRGNRNLIITLGSALFLAVVVGLAADILPKEHLSDTTRWQYMMTQFIVIPKYIILLFIPAGQNIDHHVIIPGSFTDPSLIAGLFFIVILIFLCFYLYKKDQRLISFSIAWFFAVISLRSSVLPISDLMSEHRLYAAVLGLGLFLTVSVLSLAYRMTGEIKSRSVAIAILIVITAVFSITAINRNEVWKDDLSLWKDSVTKSPEKFRPNYNAGEAYKKSGLTQTALNYYLKAYSINSESYGLCNNIGNIYSEKKDFDSAENYYIKALSLNPEYPKALNNLANVYFKKGKFEEAEKLYFSASEKDPAFIDPLLNLGHLYFLSEHYDEAVLKYKKVIELDPNHEQARNNLRIIESRMSEQIK
jgi:protein O-mannosyl-transferase